MNKNMAKKVAFVIAILAANEFLETKGYGIRALVAKATAGAAA